MEFQMRKMVLTVMKAFPHCDESFSSFIVFKAFPHSVERLDVGGGKGSFLEESGEFALFQRRLSIC